MILKGIGLAVSAIGGAFFVLSLGTQLALPWLPYFLFAALVIAFVMGLVYTIRHIDWSPKEIDAVKKLHEGAEGAKDNPVIKEILNRKS